MTAFKLQAVHQIGRRKELPTKTGEKQRYEREDIAPGKVFEVDTKEEAEQLIESGAAIRPVRAETKRVEVVALPPLPDNVDQLSVEELKKLAAERKVQLPQSADTAQAIVTELRKPAK